MIKLRNSIVLSALVLMLAACSSTSEFDKVPYNYRTAGEGEKATQQNKSSKMMSDEYKKMKMRKADKAFSSSAGKP